MKKIIVWIIIISLLASTIYIYKDRLNHLWTELQSFNDPCSKPITYQIANIDPRFKISKLEIQQLLSNAEAIFETPGETNYFEYSDTGNLKISFIYDERQETTEKLKKLGLNIDSSKADYERFKSIYLKKEQEYNEQKLAYDKDRLALEAAQRDYEQRVKFWNDKGGAPKNEYEQLRKEYEDLQTLANQLNVKAEALNNLILELNTLADGLNRLASNLNLTVVEYNTTGNSQGEEFQEGVYIQDYTGDRIEIYQYSDKQQLLRVLAHELGHALGLNHTEDKNSIMYRLNQSSNLKATKDDLAELEKVCTSKRISLESLNKLLIAK